MCLAKWINIFYVHILCLNNFCCEMIFPTYATLINNLFKIRCKTFFKISMMRDICKRDKDATISCKRICKQCIKFVILLVKM